MRLCVCLCVSALPPRSLQLSPFRTREALTRHHDEAESEAGAASCWPFSLSYSPSPATLMHAHAHTHTAPPQKLPEFELG